MTHVSKSINDMNSRKQHDYNTVYNNKFYEGTKSLKSLLDNNQLNSTLKKDLLHNHFDLGTPLSK